MAKTKTVVLFVRHYDDSEDINKVFTEACEVGKNQHFKTPSEFINEFSKIYRSIGNGSILTIENVVIG